jgi:pimeloyl-ACP methyl ester carboxylesterase
VWQPWQLRRESRVIILGHSNGGQGALYLASRYPDRTLGGSCLTSSRGHHRLLMLPRASYTGGRVGSHPNYLLPNSIDAFIRCSYIKSQAYVSWSFARLAARLCPLPPPGSLFSDNNLALGISLTRPCAPSWRRPSHRMTTTYFSRILSIHLF